MRIGVDGNMKQFRNALSRVQTLAGLYGRQAVYNSTSLSYLRHQCLPEENISLYCANLIVADFVPFQCANLLVQV